MHPFQLVSPLQGNIQIQNQPCELPPFPPATPLLHPRALPSFRALTSRADANVLYIQNQDTYSLQLEGNMSECPVEIIPSSLDRKVLKKPWKKVNSNFSLM